MIFMHMRSMLLYVICLIHVYVCICCICYMSVICCMSVICLVIGGGSQGQVIGYLMRICVITYYCKLCTLLEVWVLGVGMSTLGAETVLYVEDRGLQIPMTLEYGNIVGTQCCDTFSHTSQDLTSPLQRLDSQAEDFRQVRSDLSEWTTLIFSSGY